MNKRSLSLLLVAALTLMVVLAGCTTVVATEDAAVKTGLGIVTSYESSKDATADAAGLAETDTTYAAVTVDADGKVVKCYIDVFQSKVNFDATGKITTDLTQRVKAKNELQDEYGMRKASSIGKEWFEQAAAFADYCVGKTAEEIKGIAVRVDESNGHVYPDDADVLAGTTMAIGDITEAVVKAIESAEDLGAKASDKLGLAANVDLTDSYDATAEADGLAYAYAYISAVTVDAEGKISSAVLNAIMLRINFNASGAITTDLTQVAVDKLAMKDDYGMRARSGIGAEWFEQANAFAEYIKGKTGAEVSGLAVDESGHPTDADVLAGTTVSITHFQDTVAVAAQLAK